MPPKRIEGGFNPRSVTLDLVSCEFTAYVWFNQKLWLNVDLRIARPTRINIMIYHIEIDLNFPVIQMVYTMYGLFTVRLGTSVREYSKCNIVRFIWLLVGNSRRICFVSCSALGTLFWGFRSWGLRAAATATARAGQVYALVLPPTRPERSRCDLIFQRQRWYYNDGDGTIFRGDNRPMRGVFCLLRFTSAYGVNNVYRENYWNGT